LLTFTYIIIPTLYEPKLFYFINFYDSSSRAIEKGVCL
jgi:hypothetical protein